MKASTDKTADTTTATATRTTQEPFFAKSGEGGFFESAKQSHPPFIQTKLTINEPGDPYEQEADRMADQVVQRLAMPSQEGAKSPLSPTGKQSTGMIQTKCDACEQEEEIQRKEEEGPEEQEEIQRKEESASASPPSDDGLSARLNASKGGGSPLPKDTRADMESAFGADFSGVRVHTGGEAVAMSKGIHAQAFTHGSDVYFNEGKFDPGSGEGKRLLAHELVHVGQQANNIVFRKINDLPEVEGINSIPVPLGYEVYIKAEMPIIAFYFKKSYFDNDVTMISESEYSTSIVESLEAKSEWRERGNDFKYTVYSVYEPTFSLPDVNIPSLKYVRYERLVEIVDFFNVPENEVVTIMRGFTLDEQKMLANDKITQQKIFNALNGSEMARAIAFFSYSFDEKIKWLQNVNGIETRNVYFQDIRDLLLFTSDESREVDELLRKVIPADYIISPGILNNRKKLLEKIKQIKKFPYTPLDSGFDPSTHSTQITSSELIGVNDINESNKLYEAYLKYNDAIENDLDSIEVENRKYILELELSRSKYKTIKDYEKNLNEKNENILDNPSLDVFKASALKVAFRLLDTSEFALQVEVDQILNGQEDNIINALKKEQLNYENGLNVLYAQKEKQVKSLRTPSAIEPTANDAYNKRIREINEEYDTGKNDLLYSIRQKLGSEHPVLFDEKIDIEDLYEDYIYEKGTNQELRDLLLDNISEKQINILETRQNLMDDPDLVWKLENVIQLTKKELQLSENSFLAYIVNNKHNAVKDHDRNVQIALAVCAIAIGILSLGAGFLGYIGAISVGASLTATTYLTLASLLVGAANIVHTDHLRNQLNPASNISIGGTTSQLTTQQISKLQIALSYIGVLADFATIAIIFKIPQMGKAAIKAGDISSNASAEVKLLAGSPTGELAAYLKQSGRISSIEDFLASIAFYRQQIDLQLRFLKENIKQSIDVDIFISSLARINNELTPLAKLDDSFLKRFLQVVAEEEQIGTKIIAIGAVGTESANDVNHITTLVPITRSQLLDKLKYAKSGDFLISIGKMLKIPSQQVKEFIITLASAKPNQFIALRPYLAILGEIANNLILPEIPFGVLLKKVQSAQVSVEDVLWIARVLPNLSPEAQSIVHIRLDNTSRHFSGYLKEVYKKAGLKQLITTTDDISLSKIEKAIITEGAEIKLKDLVGYNKLTTLSEKNLFVYNTTEKNIAYAITQYNNAISAGKKIPTLPVAPRKLKKISDLFKTEKISSNYLSESRTNLVAKVNAILGEDIKSFDEFKQLITNISQSGSRGAVNEIWAPKVKVLPNLSSDTRLTINVGNKVVTSDGFNKYSKSIIEHKNGSNSFRSTQQDEYEAIVLRSEAFREQFIKAGIMKEGDDPSEAIQNIVYTVSPGPKDFGYAENMKNAPNFVDPVAESVSYFFRKIQNSTIREMLNIYYMDTKGEIFLLNNNGISKIGSF